MLRKTGATCAPRSHAYNPAHAGVNRCAVRGRSRTRHLHGDGWEGQPSGPLMGPDQNMGPGGSATPEAGGCLRAPPQQYDPLLAVRADGGVV
eukprot:scaffold26025_cov61-Phaeocystis_antarctica.AAC.2